MDRRNIPWKSEWKAAGLDPGNLTDEEQKLVPDLEAENRAFWENHPYKKPDKKPVSARKLAVLRTSVFVLPLAAAAALFLFVAVPQVSGPAPGSGLERIKGSGEPVLSVYREGKTGAEKLVSGTVVRAGDVIQAAYQVSKPTQGAILSVDGEGNVTVHLASDGRSVSLVPGEEQPLAFSYELDRAPKYEVFFLLTSDRSFDLEPVRQVLRSAAWNTLRPAAFGPGIRFAVLPLTKEVSP